MRNSRETLFVIRVYIKIADILGEIMFKKFVKSKEENTKKSFIEMKLNEIPQYRVMNNYYFDDDILKGEWYTLFYNELREKYNELKEEQKRNFSLLYEITPFLGSLKTIQTKNKWYNEIIDKKSKLSNDIYEIEKRIVVLDRFFDENYKPRVTIKDVRETFGISIEDWKRVTTSPNVPKIDLIMYYLLFVLRIVGCTSTAEVYNLFQAFDYYSSDFFSFEFRISIYYKVIKLFFRVPGNVSQWNLNNRLCEDFVYHLNKFKINETNEHKEIYDNLICLYSKGREANIKAFMSLDIPN